METPEGVTGSKRKPAFKENKPATATPTLANVQSKSRLKFQGQDAVLARGQLPTASPSMVPREALEEQQQAQFQPGSRRPSKMVHLEGEADIRLPPYYGVVAFKDAVEQNKARGPLPMSPEQNKVAPQLQNLHTHPRDGANMLTPAYMFESMYEDENQNMRRPCMFCALMPLFAITIAVIFFLFKSSQMMATLERTTTTTETTPLKTRPPYGRAIFETVDGRNTSQKSRVPLVIDDRLSSEKKLDEAKASNTTTTRDDGAELGDVAI
ncbi:hypothetical protein HPB51_028502 [Rhipicephalus microplus]|uniref:Uncharacterized protein n=1 Tax=Rhipicephalus microplus TaxID=6941 RepID=A0A9J6CX52_RHIMP|nr:hypothetical protein HPB51_028502 [Rhipicephalus microplus]